MLDLLMRIFEKYGFSPFDAIRFERTDSAGYAKLIENGYVEDLAYGVDRLTLKGYAALYRKFKDNKKIKEYRRPVIEQILIE